MKKRLTRSNTNRVLAGVLGGIGEYFDVDPVLVRVGYIFVTCVTGFIPGVVAYILALIVMPAAPIHHTHGPSEE